MEQVNSLGHSGTPGSTDFPARIIQDNNDSPIQSKDNFQCTYFRRPSLKPSVHRFSQAQGKNRTSLDDPISSNLSDTCTDSDSEADNVINVTRWLQALPESTKSCTVDDQISNPVRRAIDAPRVTFNRTVFFESDGVPRSCLKKRSMKGEADTVPKKRGRLTKKGNSLKKKNNLRNKRQNENQILRNYANQMSIKDRAFLQEIINKPPFENCSVTDQNISYATKRSHNFMDIAPSDKALFKRRKMMENKIVRNKRFLANVEEVIRMMNQNGQNLSFRTGFEFFQGNELPDEIVEINSVQRKMEEQQDRVPKKIANNRTINRIEIQRPIFEKPVLQKLLDESMDRAVKKYRIPNNNWMKLNEDNPVSLFPIKNYFS